MYFWNSYPFIRFSIALISGIICFDAFREFWSSPIIVLSISLASYCLLLFTSNRLGFYRFRHINGLIALFSIFYIGGCITLNQYHDYPDQHYLNQSTKVKAFSGTIISPVNERSNHFRYDLELNQLITLEDSSFVSTGKIHLYIRKDSLLTPYSYGDRLIIYGSFYPVPGPDNPNEFNYKKYLERQEIFSHAFVTSSNVSKIRSASPNFFLKSAFQLRKSASKIIDLYITSPRENGIAKALLLGIKDHLDNDIKKSYSAAGAMHVLAVSGLHVGIIYLIIQTLFSGLRNRGKWGKRSFGLISISIIWFYAAITGLSPSVLRAATMFSMVAIGQSTAREGNIYNTLGFAAFVLLLFDPYLIYSVGFQLSFAAVIGIVYLQPKFYRLLNFKYIVLDKAWAITCVSIAAQLATFPLTAYYFHQFPTYFLISNLIVIPASFLMLILGIFMLILQPIIPIVSAGIGFILRHFMWIVNETISLVNFLPSSLIEWIYMDKVGVVLTYLIVFTLIAALHYGSFKTLIVSASLGLLFISFYTSSVEIQSKQNKLVFYEIKNNIAIDHIQGLHSILYLDEYDKKNLELLSFQINPHRLASHLRPISESLHTLNGHFQELEGIRFGMLANMKMLIFDSTTFHLDFKNPIQCDLIIVNNESVKSLKWLSKHFVFKKIILSNKNKSYYTKKMQTQALKLGIDLHSMKLDGALTIELEDTKKERTLLPALFTTNPD